MIGFRPPAPPPGPAPNFILWFVIGLVQFLICQIAVTGLIGAIMAISSKNEWEQGGYDSSLSKFRTAKILVIVGFVLAAMVVLVFGLLTAVGAIASV